jgi:hypothetical protein
MNCEGQKAIRDWPVFVLSVRQSLIYQTTLKEGKAWFFPGTEFEIFYR